MHWYCETMTGYQRLKTREVNVGDLLLGNFHPVRVQTMTTTDTMDTAATVAQTIRCIEAGAELVRITAPSKKEAENLLQIRNALHTRGYKIPLVADIHFTPNAAEIAARIVEKVRINPGNYVDKKKFEVLEYSDAEYQEEMERIRERFTPLIKICKQYGTAMRIGTNHGSLSDRIMSRYGDTPLGMVESAMEFLRIARDESYHNIVLSMKASNPKVMVHAYRLLIRQMMDEFSECYPLHLGVTEAGDGEDGRIKSAIGIGTLMEDGIGDTIRVSLTEDPEFEIPVCKDLVERYLQRQQFGNDKSPTENRKATILSYSPFAYQRRSTRQIANVGGTHVPVVIADFFEEGKVTPASLTAIGYTYSPLTDKWNISDGAADFIYTGNKTIDFPLPGTLKVLTDYSTWLLLNEKSWTSPVIQWNELSVTGELSREMNFIVTDVAQVKDVNQMISKLEGISNAVLCIESSGVNAMQDMRNFISQLTIAKCENPVILCSETKNKSVDEQLIHFSTDAGAILLDGMGDGIWLWNNMLHAGSLQVTGRTYLEVKNNNQFLNNTAFSILQATRTRISKTEYISCPSCGRTLFDLQETTARIRSYTHHLKGVKIAIMGCIVNGPGEMADADFGYVGSGPGKITLYKGKEVVKRSVDSEVAVQELINLLRESGVWIEQEKTVLSS
ncbi:MAG TPA: (E)-4-hydroxy-3-methylbut-2-enyl-diphosphate synthase [Flavitalea sp.]|nr:(E)-4-hydroxy-3-methylbut-2-enyl-diphosphate synthase [Flavitalea sp.]